MVILIKDKNFAVCDICQETPEIFISEFSYDNEDGVLAIDVPNSMGNTGFKDFINQELAFDNMKMEWISEVDFYNKCPIFNANNNIENVGYYAEVTDL